MPPARVEGNGEIGVGRARHVEGEIGGTLQAPEVDPEMRQGVVEALLQHEVGALAHCGGAQERQGSLVLGHAFKPCLVFTVMAGLDPAIPLKKAQPCHIIGIAGSSPAMTANGSKITWMQITGRHSVKDHALNTSS